MGTVTKSAGHGLPALEVGSVGVSIFVTRSSGFLPMHRVYYTTDAGMTKAASVWWGRSPVSKVIDSSSSDPQEIVKVRRGHTCEVGEGAEVPTSHMKWWRLTPPRRQSSSIELSDEDRTRTVLNGGRQGSGRESGESDPNRLSDSLAK